VDDSVYNQFNDLLVLSQNALRKATYPLGMAYQASIVKELVVKNQYQ
jgi:hypothetical protein